MNFAARLVLSFSFLPFLVGLNAEAFAQTTVLRAVGFPQTGPNSFCGIETWTLNGVPSGPKSFGSFLGVRDNSPGATGPIPIQLGHCAGPLQDHSLLLASDYDDAFGVERGWLVRARISKI